MTLGTVRKRAMLAALFVATASGVGYVSTGKPGFSTVASALADPLSVFADRSPGGRAPGAMTNTKPNYARAERPQGDGDDPRPGSGFKPKERVLSTVRDRVPGDVTVDGNPPGEPFRIIDAPRAPDVNPNPNPNPGPPPSPPFPPPIPPIPGPGPTPGGGVPEPATWAMLLVGFFGIGAAMRRRAGIAIASSAGAR